MTTTDTTPQASPHETSSPRLAGDLATFPSHAELARTLLGTAGIATLGTLGSSGHPFSSIAPISIHEHGVARVCVSDLAEHTQNLRRDPRASIFVSEPVDDGVDPLSLARVTLVGTFVPDEPSDAEMAHHVEHHPFARNYMSFPDFSWWRFELANLRYVGGFGVMGWSTADEFAAATPDPIIPFAASMIEHLNDDHADACADIARHLGDSADALAALVSAIDRYGMTFDVSWRSGEQTIARVAFPEPLIQPDQVRAASVALVALGRAAGAA